jgi:hypothetical protein
MSDFLARLEPDSRERSVPTSKGAVVAALGGHVIDAATTGEPAFSDTLAPIPRTGFTSGDEGV